MATLGELVELNMLNECTMECTAQSRWKGTTQRYIINMLLRNLELQDEVLSGQYEVSPTIDFYINERGRVRRIEAPEVRDRVFQKSVTKNVLIPNLMPYLIYDNYASLKLRGTHFARKRFEIMLHRYINKYGIDGYLLLGDFSKYFENVDHEILKQLIAPRLAGEPVEVVEMVYYIIDHSSHSAQGLNLGGEPPQIMAVYYLGLIDTFVKVIKGVRFYGRYMDDFFVICRTKDEASALLAEIEQKAAELRLEINHKKTLIIKLEHGFTWLQTKYRIASTGKIKTSPTRSKITRERRRLKAFKRMLDAGRMTEAEIYNTYQSWRGALATDYNSCSRTLKSMDALYDSLFPEHVPQPKMGRKALIVKINNDADKEDLRLIV